MYTTVYVAERECVCVYAIFEIVLWETDGLVPIIKQTNYFIYLAFTTLTIDRLFVCVCVFHNQSGITVV